MKLTLAVATLFLTVPVCSETLCEAVQRSLISNPEIIFNSSKDFASLPRVNHSRKTWHTTLDLNTGYREGQLNPTQPSPVRQAKFFEPDSVFNQLKFDNHAESHMKTQCVAGDLALRVVHHYLLVLYREKMLGFAEANLRLHRMVFLAGGQKQNPNPVAGSGSQNITALTGEAEAELLRAQARLNDARKEYARVVGKWPSNLSLPHIPANADLPSSVGHAIEQGLDNYPEIKNRSMTSLSKSVRMSWEEWTASGLKLNTLKKQLVEDAQLRDLRLEAFKAGECPATDLLAVQKKLYENQIAYEHHEYEETVARFRILNSIGMLLPFINASEPAALAGTDTMISTESTLLAEADKVSWLYPDYKPRFPAELANAMDIPVLDTGIPDNQQAPFAATAGWYVSAGNFKNKANAVALLNRLKGLGFIVFMETRKNGSEVLIGPYEYRGHAVTGMQRLKDIAHVQGVLVPNRLEIRSG